MTIRRAPTLIGQIRQDVENYTAGSDDDSVVASFLDTDFADGGSASMTPV